MIRVTSRQYYLIFCTLSFIICAIIFHENLQNIINQLDPKSLITPILFIFLHCIVSILCLPTLVVVIAGGALFGPLYGTLLNIIGAGCGAACGFCISRYILPNKKITHPKIQKIITQTEHHGWKSVALLRLTPAPYNLINYGLGLTNIKFSHFILATLIFLIPNKIIFTCCGYYGYQ
jgi:uncharacterized membrane protein YdjX (TVP38/TMEM64 family)